ncbi:MAG: hypothetical protein Q4B95_10250 [Lonepinella koalarum]|nr:hypothetical protein [Lonepinella koalarum]
MLENTELNLIKYSDLSAKQKEIYNYHKLSSILADYGFCCMKLDNDWNGADFLAIHKDITLKVQLKARLTIAKKYIGKDLYIAFPIKDNNITKWCLIYHDKLLSIIKENSPSKLECESWNKEDGVRHTTTIASNLKQLLQKYIIGNIEYKQNLNPLIIEK